jgi:fucose permease
MAISGGAVIPLIFGKVSQLSANMQMSYLLGIVCYVMILMYGLKWHKMTGWKA